MIRRATTSIVLVSVLTILASAALVPTKAAFVDHTAASATFTAADHFLYTVSGVVTSTQDGSPVSNATVTLDDAAGTERSGLTDDNGTYEITDVPSGDYTAEATADRHASPELDPEPIPVHVGGHLTDVNFQLTPLYHVEGRVTATLGLSVLNSNVKFVHQETGEVKETTTFGLLVGGGYDLSDVRSGTHTVTVTHVLGLISVTEQVEITEDRIRDDDNGVDFRLL